jgi:hypothetical protein
MNISLDVSIVIYTGKRETFISYKIIFIPVDKSDLITVIKTSKWKEMTMFYSITAKYRLLFI